MLSLRNYLTKYKDSMEPLSPQRFFALCCVVACTAVPTVFFARLAYSEYRLSYFGEFTDATTGAPFAKKGERELISIVREYSFSVDGERFGGSLDTLPDTATPAGTVPWGLTHIDGSRDEVTSYAFRVLYDPANPSDHRFGGGMELSLVFSLIVSLIPFVIFVHFFSILVASAIKHLSNRNLANAKRQ